MLRAPTQKIMYFSGTHYLHQEEWHMPGFAKILFKEHSVSCNEQAPLPALDP
jgi:hypothetical protein